MLVDLTIWLPAGEDPDHDGAQGASSGGDDPASSVDNDVRGKSTDPGSGVEESGIEEAGVQGSMRCQTCDRETVISGVVCPCNQDLLVSLDCHLTGKKAPEVWPGNPAVSKAPVEFSALVQAENHQFHSVCFDVAGDHDPTTLVKSNSGGFC